MATIRKPSPKRRPAAPLAHVPYSVLAKHRRRRPEWPLVGAGGKNGAIYRNAETQAKLDHLQKAFGLLPAQALRLFCEHYGDDLERRIAAGEIKA